MHAQITSTIQGVVTDPTGLSLPGVEVKVNNRALSVERMATTDSTGFYRVTALPPGTYTIMVSHTGFATRSYENLEVVLNRVLTFDIAMEVGTVEQQITVQATVPLLDPDTSDTRSTIVPQQIVEMPLNGRNYLDLMQLVPGVTINKHENEGTDSSTPVLGERGGNTIFLIDGMPNRDEFGGGAAAQFNQDTIQEFQVLTTGFKAEFGHGSGGIVNVVTKSGTNDWHGSAFLFHRNAALDRNNSLDPTVTDAPALLRWDYGVTLGGPIVKDKVFFFGSAERIRESRRLNFAFPPLPPTLLQLLQDFESSFNEPTRVFETRLFAKLDEQLGQHRLSQNINVTNGHVTSFLPLSEAGSLPSTRRNFDSRTTMLGFRDTALLGSMGNPFVLNLYLQYRDEPSQERPAHLEAGPQTNFNVFSAVDTFGVFGDLGSVQFGADPGPSEFDQEYTSFGVNLAKSVGRHGLKFGVDFLRTNVDGQEFQNLRNQTFCTEANFVRFGPVNCGFFTLVTGGGLTPADSLIRLRNNYTGLYVQDDWKILSNLTLNLGLRWDYDSEFEAKDNLGPRAGFAWSPLPKTVVRGSFGIFFDHFRLGVVRRVPDFGGAAFSVVQPFSYPQLFYNLTTIAPVLFGICVHPTLTEAELAALGNPPCFLPVGPFLGVDHINNTVVTNAGGTPIPAETVVTMDNVQSLSGLTPDAFLAAVNAALPFPFPGFSWFWDPVFGVLSHTGAPAQPSPSSLDPGFATPFTRSWNLGVQQELTPDVVVSVDYIHKDIENLPGVRQTNLLFESRFPGPPRQFGPPNTLGEVLGFGPWYEGELDAVIVSVSKRFSHHFTLTGSYTYMDAVDNARIANLGAGFGTGGAGIPSDSFVGVPPVVTGTIIDCDGVTPIPASNADGSFWTGCNNTGNFVPQAGVFHNGPDLDKGRSSLALEHTFFVHGLVELPWGFQVSSIFRAQSGFPFSEATDSLDDVDGNLNFNDRNQRVERNKFTAPRFVNMDLRTSKRFQVGERVTVTALIEFFNLFNRQNPAAVEQVPGRPTPFGQPLQVLPGMETQVGLRIEF